MNIIQTNFQYRNPLIPLNFTNVKYIIVHHAEAVTAMPEDIHQWHLQNGWSGFGYNEYIRKDGTVYIGRGDNIGAQCANYNSVSYGICCEGNYQIEKEMPQAQFNSLMERVKFHLNRFHNVNVVGHKELIPTACPGQYFPLQALKDKLTEHWAQKYYNYLKEKGFNITETRFDDQIIRGEVFKLMALLAGYKEV